MDALPVVVNEEGLEDQLLPRHTREIQQAPAWKNSLRHTGSELWLHLQKISRSLMDLLPRPLSFRLPSQPFLNPKLPVLRGAGWGRHRCRLKPEQWIHNPEPPCAVFASV